MTASMEKEKAHPMLLASSKGLRASALWTDMTVTWQIFLWYFFSRYVFSYNDVNVVMAYWYTVKHWNSSRTHRVYVSDTLCKEARTPLKPWSTGVQHTSWTPTHSDTSRTRVGHVKIRFQNLFFCLLFEHVGDTRWHARDTLGTHRGDNAIFKISSVVKVKKL